MIVRAPLFNAVDIFVEKRLKNWSLSLFLSELRGVVSTIPLRQHFNDYTIR